jgi:ABC-type nitrate/sulfonate/bicarbonate transport system permease component
MTRLRGAKQGWVRAGSLVGLAFGWNILAHFKCDQRLYPSIEHLFAVSLPSLGVFAKSSNPGYTNALSVLLIHSAITIGRIVGALVLGAPLGIGLGLVIHQLRGSGPLPVMTLTIIRSVPLLALIPLFAFWFGSSAFGIFAYIVFGVVVVISSDTYEAAANLSLVQVQQATLLGGGRLFIIRTVYLPGIQPMLVGSIRHLLGLSWALALGAEYISATSGLGYIVYQSYLYSDMGKLGVLALIYMAFGFGTFMFARQFTKLMLPWAVRDEEINS